MILPVYFLGFGTPMAIAPYLRRRSARDAKYTAPRGNVEGTSSAVQLPLILSVEEVNSCPT